MLLTPFFILLLAMSEALNPNYKTTFDSYSFEYEWTISKVRGRLSKPEPLTCPEDIKSPPDKSPPSTWRLEALQATKDYYNVKLTLTSPWNVWAFVKIQTKVRDTKTSSGDDEPRYLNKPLGMSPYIQDWGYKYNTVLRCSYDTANNSFTANIPKYHFNEYLVDDSLTIHCFIFVNRLDKPVHTKNNPAIEVKAPQFDLSKLMEDARHKGRYTDVTIVSADKEFKAHKVVLASQSAFFETGLEERWKKDGAHRVEMLDVPADTMKTILTYMYTGKVENIDKSALDLLPKAEEYQLEGLKVMCEEALSKMLTAETVIDVLVMADTHNAQNLKQSCLTFITKNLTDVKKSSAWTEGKLRSEANKDLWMEVSDFIINSL